MSLLNLPIETISHVSFYVLADTPLGPPQGLLSLALTCRLLTNIVTSPHFLAKICRLKFDVEPITRRSFHPRSCDLADELTRCWSRVLQEIRQADFEDPESFVDDTLCSAYILMLNNDGKNYEQLKYAGLDAYVDRFIQSRLWEGRQMNQGWPLDDDNNSWALWLMWMTLTKEKLLAESPAAREGMILLTSPYVVLPHRYPSALNYYNLSGNSQNPYHQQPLITTSSDPPTPYPIYIKNTLSIPYFKSRMIISPPLITTAAKLLFAARTELFPAGAPGHLPQHSGESNTGITQQDFSEYKSPGTRLCRLVGWDWDTGRPRRMGGDGDGDEIEEGWEESKVWDTEWLRLRLCASAYGLQKAEGDRDQIGEECEEDGIGEEWEEDGIGEEWEEDGIGEEWEEDIGVDWELSRLCVDCGSMNLSDMWDMISGAETMSDFTPKPDTTYRDNCPLCMQRKALARQGKVPTPYEQLGNTEDLAEAITYNRQAIHLYPLGHPDYSRAIINLADAVLNRHKQSGQMVELEVAITYNREALRLCPLGHPDYSRSLVSLADALLLRYEKSGKTEDMEEAVTYHRQVLGICPPGHPDYSRSLTNLANALLVRYEQWGEMVDLEQALTYSRQVLSLCPLGHPDSRSLTNLTNALFARYEQWGEIVDLEKALTYNREALALGLDPLGYLDRSCSPARSPMMVACRPVEQSDVLEKKQIHKDRKSKQRRLPKYICNTTLSTLHFQLQASNNHNTSTQALPQEKINANGIIPTWSMYGMLPVATSQRGPDVNSSDYNIYNTISTTTADMAIEQSNQCVFYAERKFLLGTKWEKTEEMAGEVLDDLGLGRVMDEHSENKDGDVDEVNPEVMLRPSFSGKEDESSADHYVLTKLPDRYIVLCLCIRAHHPSAPLQPHERHSISIDVDALDNYAYIKSAEPVPRSSLSGNMGPSQSQALGVAQENYPIFSTNTSHHPGQHHHVQIGGVRSTMTAVQFKFVKHPHNTAAALLRFQVQASNFRNNQNGFPQALPPVKNKGDGTSLTSTLNALQLSR